MPKSGEIQIRKFFKNYASATQKGDAETIAAAYSDTYIEAAPAEVTAYKVDAEYRKALGEKSAAMKGQLGLSGAAVDLKKIEEFAPAHFLVEAEWTMAFAAGGRDPVKSSFRISYIVRFDGRSPSILLYVSHEDEEAVMKRDGVL